MHGHGSFLDTAEVAQRAGRQLGDGMEGSLVAGEMLLPAEAKGTEGACERALLVVDGSNVALHVIAAAEREHAVVTEPATQLVMHEDAVLCQAAAAGEGAGTDGAAECFVRSPPPLPRPLPRDVAHHATWGDCFL